MVQNKEEVRFGQLVKPQKYFFLDVYDNPNGNSRRYHSVAHISLKSPGLGPSQTISTSWHLIRCGLNSSDNQLVYHFLTSGKLLQNRLVFFYLL